MGNKATVLLTGATGYVGSRLLKVLESSGVPVRCLARRPEALRAAVAPETAVVAGDLLDQASLVSAMDGIQVAYYLVHSMGSAGVFEEEDRMAARNFSEVARQAGVQRIIYLGGLGDNSQELSSHLKSRQEVGQILRESGATVIEFQASIIIGSGSLSFEMIRALVERLPIMITPRWVSVLAQPIGIDDVLDYLTAASTVPVAGNQVVQIGGADRVSYGAIMREYASQRQLRRPMIRVPALTPYLSSLWLGLVTPLYARVGRRLIESIRHPTVVTDDSALQLFPIRPIGVKEIVSEALRSEDQEFAEMRWADALSPRAGHNQGQVRFGNRLVDSRVANVDVPPSVAFKPIQRIGGRAGWYYGNWLWQLRGGLDILLGGVGLRRGRRDPESVSVGDTIDCWRVEAFDPGKRLRLAAEMKLPGRAWLEFEVDGTQTSTIRQTAVFDPVGMLGLVYWYVLYPIHKHLFSGMLRRIAQAAVEEHRDPTG